QDEQRPAAALACGGLAVGEDLVALRQPVPEPRLQYPESLAVHDAYAAQSAREALLEEFDDQRGGLVAREAVQVDAVLDRPVAAAQLAQHLARYSVAQIGFLAEIERIVVRQRPAQALGQRGRLVAPALVRHGRRGRGFECDALVAFERRYVRNSLFEI